MELSWKGEGIHEIGIEIKTGKTRIKINKFYYRPTEVDELIGNPYKAKNILGWQAKTKFEELVKIMSFADWEKVKLRGY